jgi:hypothetical protein
MSSYEDAYTLADARRLFGHLGRRRVSPLPLALAGGALAVEVTTHLVNFGAYDLRIRVLDSSYEWSWSHLAATGAFAAAAVIGSIGAKRVARKRRAWLVLSALFAVLFVDNVTRFHTHVGVWPLIYAPLFGAVLVAVLAVSRDTELAGTTVAAIALLVASLGIHVFGHQLVRELGWGADSWPYQVKVALKEGTELAGWVLLVPALTSLAFGAERSRSR